MRENLLYLVIGCLMIIPSLLIYDSVPTSPIALLIGSLGVLFIVQGIFAIKEYKNTILYITLSCIVIISGILLAYLNASNPINGEYKHLFNIFIVIFTLMMFLEVYVTVTVHFLVGHDSGINF